MCEAIARAESSGNHVSEGNRVVLDGDPGLAFKRGSRGDLVARLRKGKTMSSIKGCLLVTVIASLGATQPRVGTEN